MQRFHETIKDYILRECLPGESPDELTSSTPLIKGGILDSIAVIKLVAFLEEKYDIRLEPEEINIDRLGTISDIANLVSSKTKRSSLPQP